MKSKKVRWAILGTSFISETMAAAIRESAISELVAIGSRSVTKGKLFADKFSVPKVYSDYQVLFDDADIDAVYIGLPNHLHKEFIIRCAEAGKHVLCDKPFTLNRGEAEEAFSAAEKAQVFCLEGLMYRYHPLTIKLQELIKSKVIGEIKLIHAAYTANITAFANPMEGGSIRNLGCYPLSLARLLVASEPVETTALGRLSESNPNDNQASAILKFKNKAIAVISAADDVEMFWQFEVFGTTGRLSVVTNPWLPERESNLIIVNRYNENNPTEITVKADKSLFTYQIDVLANKILGNDPIDFNESRLHSIGNVTAMAEWLRQVKASAASPTHAQASTR